MLNAPSASRRRLTIPGALALVLGGAVAVATAQSGGSPPRLNRLIEKLEQHAPAAGTVHRRAARSTDAARAVAVQDLDFVVLDVESGIDDLGQFEQSVRVLRDPDVLGPSKRAVSPLARIPRVANEAPEKVVGALLDLGVFGIMFGHIDTPADARRAVASLETRAASRPGAAALWGLTGPEYKQRATVWPRDRRGELVAIMMIESPEAAANALDIARVPGVTALFFGPGDFSRSIGKPASLPVIAPEVEAAVQTMLVACRTANIACGYPAAARSDDALRAEAERRLSQGFRVVTRVNLTQF